MIALRWLLVASMALVLGSTGGCGGPSQSALRKAAGRKRTADPPETPPKPPETTKEESAKTSPVIVSTSEMPASGPPAQDSQPATEAAKPIASNEKPDGPLTETERRARSIANLEKIANALAKYEKNHGKLPPAARDRDGDLLLSWRVLILPELGYPELHARFKHDEPWNSKSNSLLLDYIPPEYQSPERFDNQTNYLAVTGNTGVLQPTSSRQLATIKDGVDNTLAIVEVDDPYAAEWTKPIDHTPSLDLPLDRLGGLRGEGAFGVLASGRVVMVPKEMPPSRWAALFTVAGGEPIGAASFLKTPGAEPPPPTVATLADDPAAANRVMTAAEPNSEAVASLSVAKTLLPGSAGYVPDATKEVVPADQELAKAREMLKEVYGKEYEKARTREQRQKLVKTLLTNAAEFDQKPADFYEILRISRDVAASIGDVQSVLDTSDLLEQRFQLDPLDSRLKALEELSKHTKVSDSIEPALKDAKRIVRYAQASDRYDIALAAQELVARITRMQKEVSKRELSQLTQEQESIEGARSLHLAAQRGLQAIEQGSADPENHATVGRYLCFVKYRWDAGLPYLAKATDIRLRGIASLEMAPDRSQQQTLELADQMWDLGLKYKQPQRRGAQLRSIYWYHTILPRIPGSIEKLRIQRRIDESVSLYGQEEVDRVLGPLEPKTVAK